MAVVSCLALLCVWIGVELVQAETANTAVSLSSPPASISPDDLMALLPHEIAQEGITDADQACILCHADTDAMITLPSGETIAARVDTAVLDGSAHGMHADANLGCTDCHSPVDYQYPHEPVTAPDLRSYTLVQSETCTQCHVAPHLTSHPEPGSGQENVVGCTDCHGGHDVATVADIQAGALTDTCAACHTAVDVAPADVSVLNNYIQAGLFQPEYVTNDYCLACHIQPEVTLSFTNGDTVSATIDRDAYHDSVHGEALENGVLQCTQCHTDYTFPHDPVTAESARAYSLEKYPVCADCHETKYESALDDVHGAALAEGNEEAAVCTDCHGAHDVPEPDVPRQRISQTCQQCHSTIYDEYAASVHGESLIGESNPDVPTCIECHGVHNITDPTTALFRIRSPQLCAGCHADEELMTAYDISTDVFDTYVADFHGTTVTLFEHQDPNAETNKAVCYDCHGVHAIKAPDDPEAGIKTNLLETCQQCHPDATANFPDTWTSHFKPSLENNPLVFLVNLFYQIVIPATLGVFGILVTSDIYRRVRTRLRR